MSKIKIFGLGGLNENGKNMYVVDVDNNIFIFDAGLKYPSSNMLGIDYIIPKLDYLIENKDNIKGIFLSHGHEGNMGAMADILEALPDIPVYATKYTMNLLNEDLTKYKIKATNLKEIRPHSKIDIDNFSIFPICVTHSLPETVLYVLYTEDGAIVYATDFVFDSTMLGAYKTDIGKLAYVGKQGVLCLMAESMYAYRDGHTSPKNRIHKVVWDTLNKTKNRIIMSVFPCHVYRMQEMFEQIRKTRRKVVLMGKELQETVDKCLELGYLEFDKDKIGDLSNINDKDVIIFVSDDKDNPYGSLEKILNGYDKYITFKDNDTILITEPTYSGNEKKHAKILDDLSRKNVEVISLSPKDHLLHHASKEDLMLMMNLMNPKYYMPIKGEYRFMYMNATLAEYVGIPKENIILKLNGDVAYFEDGKLIDNEKIHVKTDEILIDGKNADDIGDLVLKDRELLSKNGIVIVSATLDKKTKKILANPQILNRGFIYVKDNH
ncbi:MAG: ribonuclease J [bacterium]|nr:ribonuclease J [bacterium]